MSAEAGAATIAPWLAVNYRVADLFGYDWEFGRELDAESRG